jgi:hypothetical protein
VRRRIIYVVDGEHGVQGSCEYCVGHTCVALRSLSHLMARHDAPTRKHPLSRVINLGHGVLTTPFLYHSPPENSTGHGTPISAAAALFKRELLDVLFDHCDSHIGAKTTVRRRPARPRRYTYLSTKCDAGVHTKYKNNISMGSPTLVYAAVGGHVAVAFLQRRNNSLSTI